MHNTTYRRLSNHEREDISRGLAKGMSQADIARSLKRSPSTISREVNGNSGRGGYRAFSAGQRAKIQAASRRSGKSRLAREQRIRRYVLAGLKKRWSPREIVERLKEEYPLDMTMRISHEAIYRYIYVLPRGKLKQALIKALRQERAYRRKQKQGGTEEARGKIADMLSIEERPEMVLLADETTHHPGVVAAEPVHPLVGVVTPDESESFLVLTRAVADRSIPGHWEGDLILGKYKRTALGTLVERTTRYTILVPLKAKDAVSVRRAYTKAFGTLPKEIAKTLTYDQGKEMSGHRQFTIDTGITVYFAHPGSPWERGTNENTNGLIRQYFPKGTEFDKVPVREIKRVQRELNDRPRAVLHYKKPDEVINKLVALKV